MRNAVLSIRQRAVKRAFDVVVSAAGLVVTSPVIVVALAAATVDTRKLGLFSQPRVGMGGRHFRVLKVRTMRISSGLASTVTAKSDARITKLGAIMRGLKIDELPQLVNVLVGDMSIVGPRPDVPGYADRLRGDDRLVLSVRPGITSPATLAYRHEEALLASVADPERYNRDVIWPDKVRINLEYLNSYSLVADLRCIRDTVLSVINHERKAVI